MSRKSLYSIEDRIKASEDYLNGSRGISEICASMGIKHTKTVVRWAKQYQENGPQVFYHKAINKVYSAELKTLAVEEYLSGMLSMEDVYNKYHIYAARTLKRFILEYNSNIELKDYNPIREVYMAEARRKTIKQERKEIVEYCINNELNYKETASKYDVSYHQVYSWVKKYELSGEDGLTDKRGCHKSDDEVSKIEKLLRENSRLKRQLEEKDMVVELLKKVKEFERRRF